MNGTKKTIAERLNAAQVAISNAQNDPEIRAALEPFGYSGDMLDQGRQLYDTAVRLLGEQQDATGRQQQATAQMHEKKTAADLAYRNLADVARAMLDKPDQVRLGLVGKKPTSIAGFLVSAQTLFENAALPDIQPRLARHGYNATKLSEEYAKIVAYDTANQAQKATIGEAQHATQLQNKAMTALNKWISQFRQIVKVALRDKPQLREKLGFLARSSPTAAQRQSRAQTDEDVLEPEVLTA
jgi:hypothetical protein